MHYYLVAKGFVTELIPLYVLSTWGLGGEKVQTMRLAIYYNYL